MSLINCSECGREVSMNAAACVGCGNPIAARSETMAAGAPLNTIQETSKKFKAQILISLALLFTGLVMLFSITGDPDAAADKATIPSFMFIGGLIWYIVTKFRIWWHHK